MRRDRPAGRAVVFMAVASVLVAGLLAACSHQPSLHLTAGPSQVLADDDSAFLVRDAPAGASVTLTATATDEHGHVWRSRAVFDADSRGRVDTAGQAPVSGDYTGAHATGLVFALTSGSQQAFVGDHGTMDLRVEAQADDRGSDTVEQHRLLVAPTVTQTDTHLSTDGIYGTYFAPATMTPGASAVLALGGSEGGDSSSEVEASVLAAHGHPALALAYFGAPGLPSQLSDIPIEYFGRALSWLSRRPGLASSPLVVAGASRGSEAAVLTALHYPQQVAGVIDLSPTSYAHGSFPDAGSSAWTWQGKEVPYSASMSGTPTDPGADFDVASIHAPMLFVCGEDDHLWASCDSTRQMVGQSAGLPRTALSVPGAGHLIDFVVPNVPVTSGTEDEPTQVLDVGGTAEADAVGRLEDWPKLLAFLRQTSRR